LPVTHSRRLVVAEFTGGSLLGEFLCYFAPPGYNCRRIYATICHNDTLLLLANISRKSIPRLRRLGCTKIAFKYQLVSHAVFIGIDSSP